MGRRHQFDLRQRVAQEAARIIREHGVTDFKFAKQKAAERCGLREHHHLPGNEEVEAALREHQRLFGGDRHRAHIRRLRQTACKAMRLLEPFQPRLVGPVLSGLATEHSNIQLHLFTDHTESVELFLRERGVPSEIGERRYRLHADEYCQTPVYQFSLSDIGIDAAVFGLDGLRQAPRSPVDGNPMRRMGLDEAERLANEEQTSAFG